MVIAMKPCSHIRRELRGDSTRESSEVKVLTRAGQAKWRAVALSEHCSFERTSSVVLDCRGQTWSSNPLELGEDNTGRQGIVISTCQDHRSTDDGTHQMDWQSKLGTLCRLARQAQGQADISIKPFGGRQRLGYGHSKRRSRGTLQPVGEPRAIGRNVRRTDGHVPWRNAREQRVHQTPLKWRQSLSGRRRSLSKGSLEAVLGKTHRTEF
jgi:hypothetical protein